MEWIGLNKSGDLVSPSRVAMIAYMKRFPSMQKWLRFGFMQIPDPSKNFGPILAGARLVCLTQHCPETRLYEIAIRAEWPDVAVALLKHEGIAEESEEYANATGKIESLLGSSGMAARTSEAVKGKRDAKMDHTER